MLTSALSQVHRELENCAVIYLEKAEDRGQMKKGLPASSLQPPSPIRVCRSERLGTFTHPDFVTSVHFHPFDDHIFLTGCFDKRLRLWKIPDGR